MENKMLELLKTRRSVRSYKPEQIAAQELDAVLEAGTYAPTGMGMQSPVIVAVQDAQTRQAVMELNQQARGGSGDPYYGAPVVVLVLAEGNTFVEDGTCVLENLMLAAWAKGIGTCYCGAAPMQRVVDDLKEYLKLPDNIRPFAIVTMGYPAETPKQPEGRFKEEKIHWGKY